MLVDDSAGDDAVVRPLAALSDVWVVTPPFNVGHQRAIVFGLRAIAPQVDERDWVLTMDADGEDAPRDILALARAYQQRAGAPGLGDGLRLVVLARRTSRRETWPFKILYAAFRLLCFVLAGRIVRTGNFALMRGWAARNLLLHPSFDVSYSASLLRLARDPLLVPCARASRYEGQSKMSYLGLVSHGLSMLVPFADIIATRLFAALAAVCVVSLGAVGVLSLEEFEAVAPPGWFVAAVLAAGASGLLAALCLFLFAGFHLVAQAMLSSRMTALATTDPSRHYRGAV